LVAKAPACGGRFSVIFLALRAQAMFNAVDATYRSDLQQTNELNFARFMTAVDQRFAEQNARFEKRFADLRTDMMKWMFIYWSGTMLTLAGFVFAMLQRR
jgi:hypothetical protein